MNERIAILAIYFVSLHNEKMKPTMDKPTSAIKTKEERKTAFAVRFTAVAMVLEIAAGIYAHSMALIADGIHMASHVLFIGISWYAYVLVRHLQVKHNTQYNADRVLSLSAFASGILLLVLSVVIAVHAIERFFEAEVEIKYEEAMVVAGVGLVVNAICATVLHAKHGEGDYNSHSAYLHVLSDVITSLGAIFGLVCAMLWHINWMDALVALVSSGVIMRWAVKLVMDTGRRLAAND